MVGVYKIFLYSNKKWAGLKWLMVVCSGKKFISWVRWDLSHLVLHPGTELRYTSSRWQMNEKGAVLEWWCTREGQNTREILLRTTSLTTDSKLWTSRFCMQQVNGLVQPNDCQLFKWLCNGNLFSYIFSAMLSVDYVKHISWQQFPFMFKYSYSVILPAK